VTPNCFNTAASCGKRASAAQRAACVEWLSHGGEYRGGERTELSDELALIEEDEDELEACYHTLKCRHVGISTLCCLAANAYSLVTMACPQDAAIQRLKVDVMTSAFEAVKKIRLASAKRVPRCILKTYSVPNQHTQTCPYKARGYCGQTHWHVQ
jgi:hypothetical protein